MRENLFFDLLVPWKFKILKNLRDEHIEKSFEISNVHPLDFKINKLM